MYKKILFNIIIVLVAVFGINCNSSETDTIHKIKFIDTKSSDLEANIDKQSLHLVVSYLIDSFSTDTFISTVRNTVILRKEQGLKNNNYITTHDSIYIHLQGGFNQDTILLKINNKPVIDGIYTSSPLKGFACQTKTPNINVENNTLIELKINSEPIIRKNVDLKNYKSLLVKKFDNKEIIFVVTNKSQN